MPQLSLTRIEQRLREHQPRVLDTRSFKRQAAVAAILREGAGETEVLFIKRAQRAGDVWSGQMAFPGGHREASDEDLAATAIRETREEIGLDLARHGRLLGHLDHMNVNPWGKPSGLLVVPYVFVVEEALPALQPNHEVAAVLWGSVHRMVDGSTANRREMPGYQGSRPFPGFDVHNEFVWGLTYQMLNGFFEALALTSPAADAPAPSGAPPKAPRRSV